MGIPLWVRALSWFQLTKDTKPITLDYSNPADTSGGGDFAEERQSFLNQLKGTMQAYDADPNATNPFPPVRAGSFETIPNSMGWKGLGLRASTPGPGLGKLAQHQMTNVVNPMEDLVNKDRKQMQTFLKKCS